MSLLDTIKGAQQEAQEAGSLLGSRKKDEAAPQDDDKAKAKSGHRRSSAASAKPTRELAGTVRSSASEENMTKGEKAAANERKRQEEDLMIDAKKIVLNDLPGYKTTQKIWWALLIAGIACTIVSWVSIRGLGDESVDAGNIAAFAGVLMVIAYALVIGAFIFDLVKVRPMRNKADDIVTGMTRKRMVQLVREDRERKEAEKAAKANK